MVVHTRHAYPWQIVVLVVCLSSVRTRPAMHLRDLPVGHLPPAVRISVRTSANDSQPVCEVTLRLTALNITLERTLANNHFRFEFNLGRWSTIRRTLRAATVHGPFDMIDVCAQGRHDRPALCRTFPEGDGRRSGRGHIQTVDVWREVLHALMNGRSGRLVLRSPERNNAVIPYLVMAWRGKSQFNHHKRFHLGRLERCPYKAGAL